MVDADPTPQADPPGPPATDAFMHTVQISGRQEDVPAGGHYLTVFQGVAVERSVEITSEPLVIGRGTDQDFHVPDPKVSRAHCEVRLVGGRVLVRDLGSTNGTYVDGARVSGARELPASSLLQVGSHALRHEILTAEEVLRHEQLAGDLDRARRYVEALIPARIESGPLRTDWVFVPSALLGGDALGYHELGGERFALYVIDVCGHGVGAAMHSASVLNVLRNRTLPDTDFADPSAVLAGLNAAFQMEEHNGMFVTAWYGVLDTASGALRYSAAGHPPALVLDQQGHVRERLGVKNPPIGVLARRSFAQAEATLAASESLVVYTDGAYEIPREGREGTLQDLEQELERIGAEGPRCQRVYDASLAAGDVLHLEDDFTLLELTLAPDDGR